MYMINMIIRKRGGGIFFIESINKNTKIKPNNNHAKICQVI